jgi:hypothetical protein
MDVGLLREGINEVIATTRLNAAPMGFIRRQGRVRMVVFKGSHTARGIADQGWVVANYTFDPVLFVKCAFGDLPEGSFIEETVGTLTVHRLAEVEAWEVYSAEVSGETESALTVDLTLIEEKILAPSIRPVNRGFNSLIEATVHSTRYVLNGDPVLWDLIRHHFSLVRRCGGEREMEALSLLEHCLGKAEK